MAEVVENPDTEYLVLIGAERWISSFVEKGVVIERNSTLSCGAMMAMRLLKQTFKNNNNQQQPFFREATEEEAEAYIHRLENLDPDEGDPRLIAEAARNEARKQGMVETGTLKEIERDEREEDKLQPKAKARRQRKAKKEE